MSLDNLSDVIISITDKLDARELECDFDFIYNSYIENETSVSDDVIGVRELANKKNRFIRLKLEQPKVLSSRNELFHFLDIQRSFLSEISNIDLYEEDRNYFNRLDNLFPTKISLIKDQKFNDIKNYYRLYSHANSDFEEDDFIGLDKSSKISFETNNFYENSFEEKELVEDFNYNNIKDYLSLTSSEEVKNSRREKSDYIEKFKNGVLLPNLVPISKSVNFGEISDYVHKNCLFTGLYVEKFKKEEEEYSFKCSKFFPRDNSGSFNAIIEDESIRYGQVYRYVCYYVYHFMCINEENRYILDHFLLCSHPYISSDIVCREFEAPPPPTGVTASYDKIVGKMFLSWRHPTNYENDVKGYQILKRKSLDDPFQIVQQLEGHLDTDAYELTEIVDANSISKTPGYIPDFYEDKTYDKNIMCIYTIRSIDAHGHVSDYSEQIAVYYDFLRDKLIVDSIAAHGASVNYPNETVRNKSIFFKGEADIVDNLPTVRNPKKISVYITPDYAKVSSVDGDEEVFSQEETEYQFTFSNLNSLVHRSDKFTISNFG